MKCLYLLLIIYSLFTQAQTDGHHPTKTRYTDSLLTLAGSVYFSSPDSSLYYSNLAFEYASKNQLDVDGAKALLSGARTEVLKGDIESALQHLKTAASIFEKNNMQEYLAKCYGLMSTAVSKIHNTVECINLLSKAVDIYRQLKNENGLTATLVNLANTYCDNGEFDKALTVLNESKQFTKPGDNQWFFYFINASIIYMGKKNYPLAKTQLDSCLAISRRNKMVDAEVTAITKLAELYLETKKYPEAGEYFELALHMSRIHHLPLEESEALTGQLLYFESTGDYRNAFICQKRLKVISDSLFNIEKIKNINTVEAKLKVSEKEKTIALQKLDIQKTAAEQEKSKKRIALLIAGIVLLASILFFTFYVYRKAKRQKREVELQKTRAERFNSLNQKIFAVIAHDFKSPMIALNMLMDLLDKENISKEDLNSYSSDVRNQITQSGQILDNLLNWAKTELNLSQHAKQQSRPFLVAEEIKKELTYMSTRKNISIHNQIPETVLLKVPADILRIIIRNLLSNAVKFSYSDAIVTIGFDQDRTFFVADNGQGIQEKTINELFSGTVQSKMGTFNETGFGLGLHITHELINKFNGKIWVENNHPSGTVFKFALPGYGEN